MIYGIYKLAHRLRTPLNDYSLPILIILGFITNLMFWYFNMTEGGDIFLWLAIISLTFDAVFIANVLKQYAPQRNEDVIK